MRVPTRAVPLPKDATPYWLRGRHPLAGHQSQPNLPGRASVVVIGAGLTGAATAYHLSSAARDGRERIVVLDRGDPAGEASGRNGGNFELIPENSVGVYEGLAAERLGFLRRQYRQLPVEVLQAESERQASLVLGVALRNRALMKEIILRERIDCDLSPRGWIHIASSEAEEQGICDEVLLAARHGQRIEIWSRRKLREELGVESDFVGRFIPGDGTYHPFKYVCGLLACALRAGVELYTRTGVQAVISDAPDRHRVVTDRGTIVAGSVVVGTNAFTAALFPELGDIRPRQSQILVTEHAPDRTRGRVVTCEHGPAFFNQPRGGAHEGVAPLLMGGGPDRAMRNPWSRRRSPAIHAELVALRDRFYPELRGQAGSAEWVGAMGFTPDQLPAIGFLRPGVVIAAGYNGYGGSYTTAAGLAAAEMARTGQTPDWVPADVFSPRRLLSAEPLFMAERDGLWRIAASLSGQLKRVNRAISEAVTLHTGPEVPVRVRRPARAPRPPRASIAMPAPVVRSEHLEALPVFAAFSAADLEALTVEMRRWDLTRGTVLFREGSPGGSCYVVVRGAVDVSIEARGRQQLLARLTPGSIFGQVSLIDGEARSATCTVHEASMLAEIERDACLRLLDSTSGVALKLLGALNDGLISALRGADRQLMRLGADGAREGDGELWGVSSRL